MRMMSSGALLGLFLGGCGGAASDQAGSNAVAVATPTEPVVVQPIAPAADGWLGRWIGVEGLALTVAARETPRTYDLHIALMDGAGDYTGTAEGDTIRFTRDGVVETIRHTDGAATGLKWLAGKKDCLTIKPGEGFCRD